MAKTIYSVNSNKVNVGMQHILILLVLFAVLFFLLFWQAIPMATANFVVPLFKPSGDELAKTTFVKFDGMVWATASSRFSGEQKGEIDKSGTQIGKDKINEDFIFDFSTEVRETDIHGYAKKKWEFYAKSPALGENAIILEPWVGFSIIALIAAILIAVLITSFMPSRIGYLAALFDRQIDNTQIKLRLQTGFTDSVVQVLTMPNDKLEDMDRNEVERAFRKVWERTLTDAELSSRQSISFDDLFDDETDLVLFRNEFLYSRIKEFYSDFVVKEIEDTRGGLIWRRNHLLLFKGLTLYMSHHFTEKYSNNVTGMAYGGAAILIVAVGIRGLKFIPAARPSLILAAISLEFFMLSLLAITLIYTEEEERIDKMLKKMEDANRSQLETLKGQQEDIHNLTNALVGQTSEIIRKRVESSIEQYMTSGDHVQQMVAQEIAKKIMFGIREENKYDDKRR